MHACALNSLSETPLFFAVDSFLPPPLSHFVNAVPSEQVVVAKERSAGSYRLSAYYLATTVSLLPLVLLHPSLFIIPVFPITGLVGVGNFFGTWFVMLLQYFTTQVWRRQEGEEG